ncbi:hypothetical protein Tco_0091384 [Tanacetum coccineum]
MQSPHERNRCKQETTIDEKAENTVKECTNWKDKKKDKEQEALLISEDTAVNIKYISAIFDSKFVHISIQDQFFPTWIEHDEGGKKTRQEKEYIGMVKSYYEGTQRSRQERPGEVAENSSGTAGINGGKRLRSDGDP